jgi:hypothetical protein
LVLSAGVALTIGYFTSSGHAEPGSSTNGTGSQLLVLRWPSPSAKICMLKDNQQGCWVCPANIPQETEVFSHCQWVKEPRLTRREKWRLQILMGRLEQRAKSARDLLEREEDESTQPPSIHQ